MKHILTLLIAFCAIGSLGHQAQAAQKPTVSIHAGGIQTTGNLPTVNPSFSVVAIEGRRAPDNPGIVMIGQMAVCPKCISSIGATPMANNPTFNWQTRAPDNPTIEVVIGSHGFGATWRSPAPYDPVSPTTSLVMPVAGAA